MTVRAGDTGPVVAEIRARLARAGFLSDGGSRDPHAAQFDSDVEQAVRAFQQHRGLPVDGVVGEQTFRRLEEARWRLGDRVLAYTAGHLLAGDDVADLQARLTRMGFDCGRVDGVFGPATDTAVREFQRGVGVAADGTCGPDTFRALARLSRTLGDGDAQALRQSITLTASRSGVADKVVVLDPAPDDLPAAAVVLIDDIATRVEGRLAALGTTVFLTRAASTALRPSARAAFANDVDADLVLSLHIDTWPSERATGVAAFYYGDPAGGMHSVAGAAAAEHLVRSICEYTDLLACGTMPRTWDLLRATRMPAVCLELGYFSNPRDRERLESAAFRDVVAHALADAVVEFFAPEE